MFWGGQVSITRRRFEPVFSRETPSRDTYKNRSHFAKIIDLATLKNRRTCC